MWKFTVVILGLSALAGGMWAWSERDSTSVPNQAELEAALDATVAGLDLPDREFSVQDSTCLKPLDACGPAVIATYRFAGIDDACEAVLDAAERVEVAVRDDEACWAAGYVQGRAVVVAVGSPAAGTDGVPVTVIVV